MKSVHEGQKFPCTHCESIFTSIGSLQKHIKSVHECRNNNVENVSTGIEYFEADIKKEEKEDIKEEYSEVKTFGLSSKKEYFEADIKQEEKDYKQECIDDNTDALSSQKEYFEADIKEEEE